MSEGLKIVNQIENKMKNEGKMSRKEMIELLHDLCAYIFKSQDLQPLSLLLDRGINSFFLIQEYWDFLQRRNRNNEKNGSELRGFWEAQVAYTKSYLALLARLKKDRYFLTAPILNSLINEFADPYFPRLRDKSLEIYIWILKNRPQVINPDIIRRMRMILLLNQNNDIRQGLRNALLSTLQNKPQLFKVGLRDLLLELTDSYPQFLSTTQFAGEGLEIQSISSTYLPKKVWEVLNELATYHPEFVDGEDIRGFLRGQGDSLMEGSPKCGDHVVLGTTYIQFIRAVSDNFIPHVYESFQGRKLALDGFNYVVFNDYAIPLRVCSMRSEGNVEVSPNTDFVFLADFRGFQTEIEFIGEWDGW